MRNKMALSGAVTMATELIDLWRGHHSLEIEVFKR
jgi:hypothetical protein